MIVSNRSHSWEYIAYVARMRLAVQTTLDTIKTVNVTLHVVERVKKSTAITNGKVRTHPSTAILAAIFDSDDSVSKTGSRAVQYNHPDIA